FSWVPSSPCSDPALLAALSGVRVEAQTQLTAAVGGDLVFQCSFGFSGTWKILCRQECQGDGILIQTREDSAQNGRYSVRYDRSSNSVLVHISGVTRSDSGLLLCGLAAQTSTYSVCMAQVSVTAGEPPSPAGPDWTLLDPTGPY
uniref:Immunoglobulin V-set domain-containing protein n=1 Tax=Salarias fasciatus TaxID=181472 RepID=A0A672I8D6_SALFA